MSKIKGFLIILALGVLFLAPVSVLAYSVRNEESVYIPKEQVIDGNLYMAAANITIDGNVYGDVICVAKALTINGEVDGDVICAASDITINGPVSGSVRILGENLNLNHQIKRNVSALGVNIFLGSDSKVGGDVLSASAAFSGRGQINGNLHGVSDNWLISGNVLQNVDARLNHPDGQFRLEDQARIGGSLKYMSKTEQQISPELVGGEIVRLWPKQEGFAYRNYFLHRLYGLFSALLVALVILSLWPRHSRELAVVEPKKIGTQILWGLGVMFLVPIICLLLLFTFIGWPLALILGALWFMVCYLAKILVGVSVGFWLFRHFRWKASPRGLTEMVAGVTALWVVTAIPFVGWAVSLAVIWWGLGMISQRIKIKE